MQLGVLRRIFLFLAPGLCPPIIFAYLVLYMDGLKFKSFRSAIANPAMVIVLVGFLLSVGAIGYIHFFREASMTSAEKLRKLAENFAALLAIVGTALVAVGVVISKKKKNEIKDKISNQTIQITDVVDLLLEASDWCIAGLWLLFIGWALTMSLALGPGEEKENLSKHATHEQVCNRN